MTDDINAGQVPSPAPRRVDPLHGVTLEMIVTRLQEYYGWQELSHHVDINCFRHEPSVKSSLKFLRRTPWARSKVEALYVETFGEQSR